MKYFKSILPSLLLVFIMVACNRDDLSGPQLSSDIDWSRLQTGVVNKDDAIVDTEISKLLVGSNPEPTESDEIGQFKNIDSLIIEVNESEILSAELFCYACIKTGPPQTEILLTTDSAGTGVQRIIDIITPSDGVLNFAGIHDTY